MNHQAAHGILRRALIYLMWCVAFTTYRASAMTPSPTAGGDLWLMQEDSLVTPAAVVDSAGLRAVRDSLEDVVADSLDRSVDAAAALTERGHRIGTDVKVPREVFVPKPSRALWLSLVFPGAGQIYNRKYWKLPFVYGGFLGCTYALLWNQQMYRDYSQAYLDIMDEDPNTNSYLEMLPPRYDITGREEQFKNIFKNKKNRFRRFRDMSAFCFVGVYLLSVIDAYVDANLSVFDITPDLSLSVGPAVLPQSDHTPTRRSGAYGLGCSLRF